MNSETFEELNRLSKLRYGLENDGSRYYEFIGQLFIAIMNDLESIKPKMTCELTGDVSLVDELNNMIVELEADDNVARGHDMISNETIWESGNETKDVSYKYERNKAFEDAMNFGTGVMLDNKHVPIEDVVLIEDKCKIHFDGKYTICSTHNECWETNKEGIPLSCANEFMIVHPPQLNDKQSNWMQTAHNILDNVSGIKNTHNFGNCINCTSCKDNELSKLTFGESCDIDSLSKIEKLLTQKLITRPCMKCGTPINKELLYATCDDCRGVTNETEGFIDELLTCGQCNNRDVINCPEVTIESPSLPSKLQPKCNSFEHVIDYTARCNRANRPQSHLDLTMMGSTENKE